MKEYPMPVGIPTYFEGDITKVEYKPFGIFEVQVEAPKDMGIPILQTKLNTEKGGLRTVTPLGKWTGWYLSEEIYNAEKYGYKFKILNGYLFDKQILFKDYVEQIYDIKQNSSKD